MKVLIYLDHMQIRYVQKPRFWSIKQGSFPATINHYRDFDRSEHGWREYSMVKKMHFIYFKPIIGSILSGEPRIGHVAK